MAERLRVTLEKPVAGGHALARVGGRVVLVRGGIPGETVRVEIERTGKGVAFATVVEIEEPSPDRVSPAGDPACGGLALAHVAYPRQLQMKEAIVEDALVRIGRLRDLPPITSMASPAQEWRLRARLHVVGRRVGFFREGTHALCDAAATGQLAPGLLPLAEAVIDSLTESMARSVEAVMVTSTVSGDQHAVHLELSRPLPRHGAVWSSGDTPPELGSRCMGVSAGLSGSRHLTTICGHPWVRESWAALGCGDTSGGGLTRHAAAFFQGNRALLPTLLREIAQAVPTDRPLVDLYAGVGLFGLAMATRGTGAVTCVEGDPVSGEDLVANAAAFEGRVTAVRSDVESFVRRDAPQLARACVIVDPPRTGLSPVVSAALAAARPASVVYVSCDPATLARDLRILIDGGMRLERVVVFDLFPQTAHVESVVTLSRVAG